MPNPVRLAASGPEQDVGGLAHAAQAPQQKTPQGDDGEVMRRYRLRAGERDQRRGVVAEPVIMVVGLRQGGLPDSWPEGLGALERRAGGLASRRVRSGARLATLLPVNPEVGDGQMGPGGGETRVEIHRLLEGRQGPIHAGPGQVGRGGKSAQVGLVGRQVIGWHLVQHRDFPGAQGGVQ